MTYTSPLKSERYRSHAEEARVICEQMTDEGCRRSMAKIAADYERWAARAEMIEREMGRGDADL